MGAIFQPVPIRFHWNANTEAGILGYKLYAGRASGLYDSNVDMGNVTTGAFRVAKGSGVWYFALTAYTASAQSGFATEVSTTV